MRPHDHRPDDDLRALLADYRALERMPAGERNAAWRRIEAELRAPAAPIAPATRSPARFLPAAVLLAAAALLAVWLRHDRAVRGPAERAPQAFNNWSSATPPTRLESRSDGSAPPADQALNLSSSAATSPSRVESHHDESFHESPQPADTQLSGGSAGEALHAGDTQLSGGSAGQSPHPTDTQHPGGSARKPAHPADTQIHGGSARKPAHPADTQHPGGSARKPAHPADTQIHGGSAGESPHPAGTRIPADAGARPPTDPQPAARRLAPREPADARPAHEPVATAEPPPDATVALDLERELALLRAARDALARGDGEAAAAALAEHARRFPTGHLREERLLLHVEALCAAGERDAARRAAAEFAAQHAGSPHAKKILRVCP
jgi:TolA-binding protein